MVFVILIIFQQGLKILAASRKWCTLMSGALALTSTERDLANGMVYHRNFLHCKRYDFLSSEYKIGENHLHMGNFALKELSLTSVAAFASIVQV